MYSVANVFSTTATFDPNAAGSRFYIYLQFGTQNVDIPSPIVLQFR